MTDFDENKPLSELFNIKPEDYSDISVLSLPFSVRVVNRFKSNKIDTVL